MFKYFHYRSYSGKTSDQKNFRKIFIAPKDSSLNFKASLSSYFRASMLISAVIDILDPFGMLIPRNSAIVKT